MKKEIWKQIMDMSRKHDRNKETKTDRVNKYDHNPN